MLKQRILTALVLLFIIGAVLAAPSPWPFLVFLCLVAGCALWEWLRLVVDAVWVRRTVPVLVVLCMLCLSGSMIQGAGSAWAWRPAFDHGLLPLVALFWVVAATTMVLRGRLVAPFGPRVLAACAIPILLAVWYALAAFFLNFGVGTLLSMLILIWCADIAAYFSRARRSRRPCRARPPPESRAGQAPWSRQIVRNQSSRSLRPSPCHRIPAHGSTSRAE